MTASVAAPGEHREGARSAVLLLLIRLGSVAIVTVLAWMVLSATLGAVSFPPSPMVASLSLLPANVICLVLAARMTRATGRTVREVFGFERRRLLRDVGWALVWMTVLALPFVAAVTAVMWLLHGAGMFAAFETVFYDPAAGSLSSPALALALGVTAVLTFAPLNAPAEELVYRGVAQAGLTAARSPVVAIAVCSLVFGLQHAFFAPTEHAMVVYVVAFTVWGIGSGMIVHRQRRLAPITIAHFLVNLMTSAPAVVFPLLQLTGVV